MLDSWQLICESSPWRTVSVCSVLPSRKSLSDLWSDQRLEMSGVLPLLPRPLSPCNLESTCPSCRRPSISPRLLGCLHSVCTPCLNKVRSSSLLPTFLPWCKQNISPVGRAVWNNHLPRNIFPFPRHKLSEKHLFIATSKNFTEILSSNHPVFFAVILLLFIDLSWHGGHNEHSLCPVIVKILQRKIFRQIFVFRIYWFPFFNISIIYQIRILINHRSPRLMTGWGCNTSM